MLKSPPRRSAKSTRTVLEALQMLNHATAPEIMQWINQSPGHASDRKVSLTSVYRALNQLVDDLHVKPLNFNDGQIRYELNNQRMHHHHLVCSKCERIQVLDSCPFQPLLAQLEGTFQVHYHNFEVFGLCQSCLSN
jgi:Fur family ferric uptake transcriptional regulator